MGTMSSSVQPVLLAFLLCLFLNILPHCNAEFNFEVGLRIQERLTEFLSTPSHLLSVVSRGQTNGAFPASPDRDLFLLIGDALLKSYPHWMIYYGLENGELSGNFHTPRLGEYREPGNGGYLEGSEEWNVHYDTCVSANGTTVPCRMSVGDQYIACIDDCNLQPCENPESRVDCSTFQEGGAERRTCEEQITWCQTYEIKTVAEEDGPRGYIPLYEYCLDDNGLPSQTEGEIYKFHDGVAGSCYYNDKMTLVDRSEAGKFSYCNKNKETCSVTEDESLFASCGTTTVGAFQQFNYDPRYRPWYIQAKQIQKPYWTPPFIFWDPPDMGSTYVQPFYKQTDDGRKVFDGVLALDYKFLDIASFLSDNYEDSDTLVAIVEETSPNYLIATSKGGIGSKRVLASDETQLCPEDGMEECKTVRVKVADFGGAVSLAFDMHLEQQFPEARLLPVSFDGSVYASQTIMFDLLGDHMKWRILIMSPIEAASEDVISANEALSIGILVPSLFGALVCSLFLALFLKHRRTREVASSDWRFTGAFIFNCILLNLSCLSFLGENTDELCLLRMWLLHFFFVLTIAPLLVKTYRMYLLVGKSEINRTSLPHTKTALMMTPFIVVEVLILLIFTFVDPSKETELIEQDGSTVSYRVVCSHDTEAFFATQLVYSGGLLLVGCFLSFKSRNVRKELNDAKPLIIAMYNIALVSSLVLIVAKVVNIPDGPIRVLVTVGVAWSTFFSSSVFVLPRLLQVQRAIAEKKKNDFYNSQQSGLQSGAPGIHLSGAASSVMLTSVQESNDEEKEEES